MANYSFEHLSSYEFELLCRDVLQKEMDIYLESFKTGKDGGVDLRCSATEDKEIIVQCKRYVESDFNQLMSTMRSEVEKLKAIVPSRYVLCTSLGLLPQQKKLLLELLNPYCLQTTDIFGKDDINNLLTKFSEVEKNHFKLWLHSFEMLKTVQHASTINFTKAEMTRIERKRQYYVQTDSFTKAVEILKEKHYCVITGIPGIGKTTLAEMLLLWYGTLTFEVIKVSEDIDEAHALHDPTKKQIFYYDDFLGQTGLQNKLGKNEDDRLLGFINLVSNSSNTRFILTTREYILKQAESNYERISRFQFEKCVLEPPNYSDVQKAQILFNHLFFSKLKPEYFQAIVKSTNFLKIVAHRGFNPRLIEYMTESKIADTISPDQYVTKFLSHFSNPEAIWSHAFRHQISQAAKNLLLVLTTLPSEVFIDDLEKAYDKFHFHNAQKYNLTRSSQDFLDALRELEDTFLRVEKTAVGDAVKISFHNPSVRDFMQNFLSENPVLCQELVELSCFFEQLEFLLNPKATEGATKIIAAHSRRSGGLAQALIDNFGIESAEVRRWWHSTANTYTEIRSESERVNSFDTLFLKV